MRLNPNVGLLLKLDVNACGGVWNFLFEIGSELPAWDHPSFFIQM